jgi:Uma2 family endonuclease
MACAELHSKRRAEHSMGMPAIESRRWTAADVRALPDEPGKRFEVIDGELFVSPAPSLPHQRLVRGIFRELDAYCVATSIGEAMFSPADIEIDALTLVQPDIFVVPHRDGPRIREWHEVTSLLLAVEVISPTSARRDRILKRRKYAEFGAEYWIVDGDARVIERWLPADERPEILVSDVRWMPRGAAEPLVIDIAAYVHDALGE